MKTVSCSDLGAFHVDVSNWDVRNLSKNPSNLTSLSSGWSPLKNSNTNYKIKNEIQKITAWIEMFAMFKLKYILVFKKTKFFCICFRFSFINKIKLRFITMVFLALPLSCQ